MCFCFPFSLPPIPLFLSGIRCSTEECTKKWVSTLEQQADGRYSCCVCVCVCVHVCVETWMNDLFAACGDFRVCPCAFLWACTSIPTCTEALDFDTVCDDPGPWPFGEPKPFL
jgi:hypothetical protein